MIMYRCELWASSGPFPLSAHYGLYKRGRDPPPPNPSCHLKKEKSLLPLKWLLKEDQGRRPTAASATAAAPPRAAVVPLAETATSPCLVHELSACSLLAAAAATVASGRHCRRRCQIAALPSPSPPRTTPPPVLHCHNHLPQSRDLSPSRIFLRLVTQPRFHPTPLSPPLTFPTPSPSSPPHCGSATSQGRDFSSSELFLQPSTDARRNSIPLIPPSQFLFLFADRLPTLFIPPHVSCPPQPPPPSTIIPNFMSPPPFSQVHRRPRPKFHRSERLALRLPSPKRPIIPLPRNP